MLLSQDGLSKVRHHLASMTADDMLITIPDFANVETQARKIILAPKEGGALITRTNKSLIVIAAALRILDLFPIAALEQAVQRFQARFAERNLPVIEASTVLVDQSMH